MIYSRNSDFSLSIRQLLTALGVAKPNRDRDRALRCRVSEVSRRDALDLLQARQRLYCAAFR